MIAGNVPSNVLRFLTDVLSVVAIQGSLNIMSSPAGKRPKPLNTQELKKILAEALKNGSYTETLHARFDHVERNIDLNDVLYGLSLADWKVKGQPEFDDEFWQWKYEIHTNDIEGETLAVIVAVDPRNKSFEVITRWKPDTQTTTAGSI